MCRDRARLLKRAAVAPPAYHLPSVGSVEPFAIELRLPRQKENGPRSWNATPVHNWQVWRLRALEQLEKEIVLLVLRAHGQDPKRRPSEKTQPHSWNGSKLVKRTCPRGSLWIARKSVVRGSTLRWYRRLFSSAVRGQYHVVGCRCYLPLELLRRGRRTGRADP